LDVKCRSILAILTSDESKSSEEWEKVSMPIMLLASKPSVQLSLARSEMLVRAFSRREPSSKEMPEYLNLAFSLSVPGLMEAESGRTDLPPVRPGELYTLDAMQRARALTEGTSLLLGAMQPGDRPSEALPLLGVGQDLLGALPPGIRTPAGLIGPVSDAYRFQAASWIRLEGTVQPDTYADMDKVLPQGAGVILDHEKFLVGALDRVERDARASGGGGDPSDEKYELPVTAPPLGAERLQKLRALVAERRRGVRQQARELVDVGRRQRESERFGTLLREGEALDVDLCRSSADASPADCSGLKNLLTEIGRGNSEFASSLLRAPSAGRNGSQTAWADADGFALGGLDPVTCFDAPGSLVRAVAQTRQGVAPEADAPRTCNVRMGRLGYAHAWGGRVWLFEREENRSRFVKSPETYAPQLGGYDVRAVQQSTRPKQYPQSTGMIIGGQLYLLQGYMDPASLAPADILQVKQNWQSIKAMPEAKEPGMESTSFREDVIYTFDPATNTYAPADAAVPAEGSPNGGPAPVDPPAADVASATEDAAKPRKRR
jgi:hypothetical protein